MHVWIDWSIHASQFLVCFDDMAPGGLIAQIRLASATWPGATTFMAVAAHTSTAFAFFLGTEVRYIQIGTLLCCSNQIYTSII
jgi:hypothetical protein